MSHSGPFAVDRNRRILIVDDNQAIHADFRKILSNGTARSGAMDEVCSAVFGDAAPGPVQDDFEIDSAFQGREALELVRRALAEGRPYGMAFIDVRMPPGWDGIVTIRRIWDEYPQLEVVICTAYSDYSWDKVVEMLDQSHRLLILKKPFDNIEVRQLACALTEKWNLERQASVKVEDLERMVAERARELEEVHAELQQAQKMEAIGRLAGGVAHDFNNLLTSILGYGEIALDQLDPSHPVAACIEEMRLAGQCAASLTNQLLSFSRKQMLSLTDVNLNALVEEMAGLLRCSIHDGIALAVALAPDLRLVKADSTQMEQVLLNLTVNARDAMPDGGSLSIETRNIELDAEFVRSVGGIQPGPYVLVSITDTGSGMDENTKAHIFEPFFTTKPKGQGTGMGLPMVYGIVKQSGGHISFDSRLGQGTTFHIYLPALLTGSEVARKTPVQAPERRRGNETILLVEDEGAVRKLARQCLVSHGYVVFDFADGEEALEFSEQYASPIDLLLTDVVMPKMNGRQLAERLTASRCGIKVIYLSGYPRDVIGNQGVLDPETPLIQKPFTRDSLCNKIQYVFDPDRNPAQQFVAPASVTTAS